MYDLRTYFATKDLPGGPIYVEEHLTTESYLIDQSNQETEIAPLTSSQCVAGVASSILFIGTLIYLMVYL